jgi:hypothetical protein
MKAIILFIFAFLMIFSLYSEEIESNEESESWGIQKEYNLDAKKVYSPILYGKIGYSFLTDVNINFGLDLAFDVRYPWQWEWIFIEHILGIEYQYFFNNNESILRLNYIKTIFFFGGIGISCLYNISNNEIGIAPQIGIVNYFFYSFIFNCYYRYNVNLTNIDRSFHEIILTFNIALPINLGKKVSQ